MSFVAVSGFYRDRVLIYAVRVLINAVWFFCDIYASSMFVFWYVLIFDNILRLF